MSEVSPRLVINASSGGSDWAVTAQAPIRLAMTAAKQGVRLVHVSSDAVFSGARVHYDESSLPDPISPYGAAKAAAETGVLAVYPEAVVARTSLIIGDGGSVHERLVHELAAGTRDGTHHDAVPGTNNDEREADGTRTSSEAACRGRRPGSDDVGGRHGPGHADLSYESHYYVNSSYGTFLFCVNRGSSVEQLP